MKVPPLASNVDRCFELMTRYLDMLVAQSADVERGAMDLLFPWDVPELIPWGNALYNALGPMPPIQRLALLYFYEEGLLRAGTKQVEIKILEQIAAEIARMAVGGVARAFIADEIRNAAQTHRGLEPVRMADCPVGRRRNATRAFPRRPRV